MECDVHELLLLRLLVKVLVVLAPVSLLSIVVMVTGDDNEWCW